MAITAGAFAAFDALHQDEVFRFVRQCQLAAGACLIPRNSGQLFCAAWETLRSHPSSGDFRALSQVSRPIAQLATHVLRSASQLTSDEPADNGRREPELLTARALNVMFRQFTDASLRLSDIARAVGVSDSHLSRTIHSVSGHTFLTHLSGIRVLAAIVLLASSEDAVCLIAARSGYHHTGELDRDFRKWLGVAPMEFRRAVASL